MKKKRKQNKSKWKKQKEEKKKNLINKVKTYSNNLKNPSFRINYNEIKSNSWFDILKTDNTNLFDKKILDNLTFDTSYNKYDGLYTKKIEILPNENQKTIILKWMDAYILMYNIVTKYYKKQRFNKLKYEFNIGKLKKLFSKDKESIIKWSGLKVNNKIITINSHILDYAINDALMRLKSCLSNLRNGNIRHFRLRYLKMTKNNKILKLEKLAVKENGFCIQALGPMKSTIGDFNYLSNITTMTTLQYKYDTNKFILLIKYKIKNNIVEPNRDVISLDPGIRTFLTGYSNNHITKIGNNMNKTIKNKLKQIDSIMNNKNFNTKKKNKIQNKKYDKIKNLIVDSHWKIANYLTSKYKTILIGNFSTKSMGESKKIAKIVKRIGNSYNFYKFKQRLQYKCMQKGSNYKEIDEAYTSKCCSNCGNIKINLKGSKIYSCYNCKIIIDRDINGAKGILLASL